MALKIYRRHTATCCTNTPGTVQFNTLSVAEKRAWTACDCPIWFTGTLDGREFPRRTCKTRDWEEAKRLVAGLAAEPAPRAAEGGGVSLRVATLDFIERREREDAISSSYSNHYNLVLGTLVRYADTCGVRYTNELTVKFLEDYKKHAMPGAKNSSRNTYVGRLKEFLKDCDRLEIVKPGLDGRIKRYRAIEDDGQTPPFEQHEVDRLLGAAAPMDRLVILLMHETGLRSSDAVSFDPANVFLDEHAPELLTYSFRMKKQRRGRRQSQHEIFIERSFFEELQQVRPYWRSDNLPFRRLNKTLGQDQDALWYRMQVLGSVLGIDECRPHRLRDTFAVRRLEAGMGLEDVSKLLCHANVAQTERAYAPWTRGRKRRLGHVAAAYFDWRRRSDAAAPEVPRVKLLGGSERYAERPGPQASAPRDAGDVVVPGEPAPHGLG